MRPAPAAAQPHLNVLQPLMTLTQVEQPLPPVQQRATAAGAMNLHRDSFIQQIAHPNSHERNIK